MNSTKDEQNQEKAAMRSREAAMLSALTGANDRPIESGYDTFGGSKILDLETGETARPEAHSARVTQRQVEHDLWEKAEIAFQGKDAEQAEALVAEITGKDTDPAEVEKAEKDNALSQEERLAEAETKLKDFFRELAEELVPLINKSTAEILKDETVGDYSTDQLGEKGDINIALANMEVARQLVEAFQEKGMKFSGYERAFNDKTREGFVLENRESGLRFMFIYNRPMAKAERKARPETPVAKPDEANARMPDQAAPKHTTEAAADSKHEVQDRTVAAKRAAAAQQQAANEPPEIEALFGSGAARAGQAADQRSANEPPSQARSKDKKKAA